MTNSLDQQIQQAAQLLLQNEVVGFPTETVYGLGAVIHSEPAIQKIFKTKERPFFDPLIVHVASIEQAQDCVSEWNELSQILAKKFWPGPLTLVLPKADIISELITSGLTTVGIRWPKHKVAEALIQKVGSPLAAPSANKFGRTSPTKASHVKQEFQNQIFVIEGDDCEIGIESTVLSVKKRNEMYSLSLLRKGAVLKSQIEQTLAEHHFKYEWSTLANKNESPGNMKHHYMPAIPFVICRNPAMKLSELSVLLNSKLKDLPDVVEGVKIVKPKEQISKIEFLKLADNPVQAAREMYSQLRSASQRNPQVLCFIQLKQHSGEMWESLFDRLYKAASLIVD